MNYLAHLYLAQRTGTSAAGALLGDFVRGRLAGGLPADVETGIRLHRRVDTYTDSHPEVVAARRSFDPPLRRYAGILIDLYFDHILACRWPQWHPDPLPEFAADCAAKLRAAWPTG
ncbi:MAG: ACP phosphodiesterase, partial [Salinisphaera sp.]|nr:ACP phosphodiesterase [Salinisphaera sp.]